MKIAEIIRNRRKALGLSQTKLAFRSKVSLPTLQRIEAGTANASLATVENILTTLGISLKFEVAEVPWDELAYLGVPLAQNNEVYIQRTPLALMEHLRVAVQTTNPEELPREYEALAASLLALWIHYPTFFNDLAQQAPRAQHIASAKPTGKLIKLKRIALKSFGEYL